MFLFEGIILIKLWFDVSNEQQELRFQKRLSRPWKRWKLSPMDLYARSRWSDYAEARDVMFARTGSTVPWAVIPSDDKKVARLNAITHILASIDYQQIEWDDAMVVPPLHVGASHPKPPVLAPRLARRPLWQVPKV